ncbi:MAG: hypothetical protein HN368_24555, partial [Spirochaetales bacterium]|nr:hypothetical protein [Spirochaetales bacterium]
MDRSDLDYRIQEIKCLKAKLESALSDSDESLIPGGEIPDGIRVYIDKILDMIPTDIRHVMTIAAALGNSFSLRFLSELLERPLDEIADFFETDFLDGLFEESETSPVERRFRYRPVQNAILSALSATQKMRINADAASLLEQQYLAGQRSELRALVAFLANALPVHGVSKCAAYAKLYAEAKLRQLDPDDAADILEYVTEKIKISGEAWSPGDMAPLYSILAKAVYEQDELRKAESFITKSFDLYVSANDIESACSAAMMRITGGGIRKHAMRALPYSYGTASLIMKAKQLVEPGTVLYGWLLVSDNMPEGYRQAFKISRELSDGKLESSALARLLKVEGTVKDGHGTFHENRVLKSDEVIDHARRSGNVSAEFCARILKQDSCIALGRLREAKRSAIEMTDIAKSLDRTSLASAQGQLAIIFALTGYWDDCRRAAKLCIELSPKVNSILLCALDTLAVAEFQTGNWTRKEQHEDALLANGAGNPTHFFGTISIPTICSIIDDREYLDKAMDNLIWGEWQKFAADPDFIGFNVNTYRASVTMGVYIQKDREKAQALIDVFKHQPGLIIGSLSFAASADRLMGLLLIVLDRLDEAIEHFDQAITFAEQATIWPDFAWAHYELAGTLCKRGDKGDWSRAKMVLQKGRTTASIYGMNPLVAKIDRKIENLESQSGWP